VIPGARPDRPCSGASGPRGDSPVAAIAGVVVVMALVALVAGLIFSRVSGPALREDRVLVVPVEVVGAEDDDLSRRVTALLAEEVDGHRGLHPVESDRVLEEWPAGWGDPVERGRGLESARRLDAGWVLVGQVTPTPARLTLTGTLYSARSGNLEARVSQAGPPDSLPALVRGLIHGIEVFDAALQ
jgi:hypothetical protein